MKKTLLILGIVIALGGLGYLGYLFFFKNLTGEIALPYIAHQKPRMDPHIQSAVPVADKLDEALFDGLFNVAAGKSGVLYEDGLGEFIGIDAQNVVTIRLKSTRQWHRSFRTTLDKGVASVSPESPALFAADDLRFTLRRIQQLGSLSPDYILIGQAVKEFDFQGPDNNGEIHFQFRGDRLWNEADIKEVLSFKILPAQAGNDALQYTEGTGPYLYAGEYKDLMIFPKNPAGEAQVPLLHLKPFIDNSTYTTELRSKNINALLSTPFGSLSPILSDAGRYFYKSTISTAFFAIYFNTEHLNLAQRKALRQLIDPRKILYRFFNVGSAQQRHVANYKGDGDNYEEYLNYSLFPSTSYYVEEQIVNPPRVQEADADLSSLPDTVRIQTCIDFDFREEISQMVEILNDPALTGGRLKVTAVKNEELGRGVYDAVLVPVTGYRSNFLFDLYSIFLREPDLSVSRINLQTRTDDKGVAAADPASFSADKNFFRLDLSGDSPERDSLAKLLEYVYGFMSSSEVGDKQQYAQSIDQLERDLALGRWLFSLPSLAYFSTQFDASTVDLYGIASQLSTIEKWREAPKK